MTELCTCRLSSWQKKVFGSLGGEHRGVRTTCLPGVDWDSKCGIEIFAVIKFIFFCIHFPSNSKNKLFSILFYCFDLTSTKR